MILLDLVTRIADDSNVNTGVASVKSRIIREINRVSSEIWDGFRWTFRWRNYRIVTDVDVTAGTITATNGSRTIVGAGTSFLSTNATWHITFPQDPIQNWYKVRAFTSSTQLELDVPYTGVTGSGKTYILRHFDYVLPTEPWDMAAVTVTNDNRTIPIFEPTSIDILSPIPFYKGFPQAVAIFSSDIKPTVYSTGTVTGSQNSQILTGSGTSWLANIYPGDLVAIGANSYNVLSVDSDTQITLYNNQIIASAGATYTITRQFGRIIRIMWPSTDQYTIDIRALRKYAPLVNDNDTNELLYRFPNTVAMKVSALELTSQGDKRATLVNQMADASVLRCRAEDDSITTRDQYAPIYSYRTDRRNLYGTSFR